MIVFEKEVLKQLHQQWKTGKLNTRTYKGIKGHVDDFVKDDIHFKYKELKKKLIWLNRKIIDVGMFLHQ